MGVNPKALGDIENNRNRNLMAKATEYSFTAIHIPGRLNLITEARSRFLSDAAPAEEGPDTEGQSSMRVAVGAIQLTHSRTQEEMEIMGGEMSLTLATACLQVNRIRMEKPTMEEDEEASNSDKQWDAAAANY
jgi:hypothetical protein